MFTHVKTSLSTRSPFHRIAPALAAFVLGLACVASSSSAAVVCVKPGGNDANDGMGWDKAKKTVSGGLKAATDGDQVWVAAGTYVERITLKKDVALYGGLAGNEDLGNFNLDDRDVLKNKTTLDGNNAGSVVTAPSGATSTCRIDGFTITRGSASKGGGLYMDSCSATIANNTITGNTASTYPAYGGGGLYLDNSSPTITNNTITGNDAVRRGGGLYLDNSSPTIANNTITGNRAYSDGGGLYLHNHSSATIANNTITGNRVSYPGGGGGLHVSTSSPTITNNTITTNSAPSGGGIYLYNSSPTIANNTITGNIIGGGLYLTDSSPTIVSNTITGNSTSYVGGGLYLDSSSPTIANNTITGNRASYGGGGLYLDSSTPMIANNTIVGNGASDGGGLYLSSSSPTIANTIVASNSSGMYGAGSASPTLRHNCVFGNTAYDYSGVTDPTGTDGNISADPRLADPGYGNHHIQPDSPCVDAGDNAYGYGDIDIDGQPRIQPDGGTLDIGADESDGTVWPPGPYAIVRVRPDGDDAADGSSWASAKRTVQAGIDAASAIGGDVWAQAGTYFERITLQLYVHVYGGFAGSETDRQQRDWSANITILDGQRKGSVATALAGYRVSTIDGFTITHGSAVGGGGLYLEYSSPTIARDITKSR